MMGLYWQAAIDADTTQLHHNEHTFTAQTARTAHTEHTRSTQSSYTLVTRRPATLFFPRR